MYILNANPERKMTNGGVYLLPF